MALVYSVKLFAVLAASFVGNRAIGGLHDAETCTTRATNDDYDDATELNLLQQNTVVQRKRVTKLSFSRWEDEQLQPQLVQPTPPLFLLQPAPPTTRLAPPAPFLAVPIFAELAATKQPESKPASGFKDVLLIVHCRQSAEICEQRRPLAEMYRKYFKDMKLMTVYNQVGSCNMSLWQGDPHLCLSRIMEDEGSQYEGVFYMHFDAVLSPCSLGSHFDATSLGWFNSDTLTVDIAHLEECKLTPDCNATEEVPWFWDETQKQGWSDTVFAIQQQPYMQHLSPEQLQASTTNFQVGVNDLFYIPKLAYPSFIELAKIFAHNQIWHEVAGGSMRQIMQTYVGIPAQYFGCTGSCCTHLGPQDLQAPGFECGHKFDYTQESTLHAVEALLATEAECPGPVSHQASSEGGP